MQPVQTAGDEQFKRFAKPQPLQAAEIPHALLTITVASAVSGLSPSTIYRKAASDPTFPKMVRLSSRCTRIRAGDLTAWLAAQAEKVGDV